MIGATVADAAGNEVALDATEDIDFALALTEEACDKAAGDAEAAALATAADPDATGVTAGAAKTFEARRRAIMQEEILSMAAVCGGLIKSRMGWKDDTYCSEIRSPFICEKQPTKCGKLFVKRALGSLAKFIRRGNQRSPSSNSEHSDHKTKPCSRLRDRDRA